MVFMLTEGTNHENVWQTGVTTSLFSNLKH